MVPGLQQWKFYIRAAGNEKEKVKGYIPLAATCFQQLNLTLVISRAQTADSGERAERRVVFMGASEEYCEKYLGKLAGSGRTPPALLSAGASFFHQWAVFHSSGKSRLIVLTLFSRAT